MHEFGFIIFFSPNLLPQILDQGSLHFPGFRYGKWTYLCTFPATPDVVCFLLVCAIRYKQSQAVSHQRSSLFAKSVWIFTSWFSTLNFFLSGKRVDEIVLDKGPGAPWYRCMAVSWCGLGSWLLSSTATEIPSWPEAGLAFASPVFQHEERSSLF